MINTKLIEDYDPLAADPLEFGRELFLGALNRYLASGKITNENEDEYKLKKYDSKKWKSGEDLLYVFLNLAVDARVKEKDYWKAINLVNIVQALDAEPSQLTCSPKCREKPYISPVCLISPMEGPNPALSLLRAESFYQLGNFEHALRCVTYSMNMYGHELILAPQTPNYQYKPDMYTNALAHLFQVLIIFKARAFGDARLAMAHFEANIFPLYSDFMKVSPPETWNLTEKLTELLNSIKNGLQGKMVRHIGNFISIF